ncbi:MAG: hypothetical protein FJ224_04850 [Lentisphaerae bacterium]|nr:hypothetical protein [Lentisphaerota bacterium]
MQENAAQRERMSSSDWVTPFLPGSLNAGVFGGVGAGTLQGGPVSQRFRLAGTFTADGDDDGTEHRRAVIDELSARAQHVVSEGSAIGDAVIVRISADKVVVKLGSVEEDLLLTFSGPTAEAVSHDSTGLVGAASSGIPGSPDAFGGVRTGENRWVYSRKALVDYYSTLRDSPERLVAVFDSLKPVYGENRRINGYRLGIEGEKEFFDSVGLREGDIVRKANSIEMSSRRRAEFLISQFVQDKANVFVLDVDRDGQDMRLVYEVR